jgi:hypothetical protein
MEIEEIVSIAPAAPKGDQSWILLNLNSFYDMFTKNMSDCFRFC